MRVRERHGRYSRTAKFAAGRGGRLRTPRGVEVGCIVEAASPDTLKAYVLNQRRGVIQNGLLQSTREPGHLDILHSFDLAPMSDEELNRGSGDKEGLAAEDGLTVNKGGIPFYIPG